METSKGEVMAARFGRTEMPRNQHWQTFADVHPLWPPFICVTTEKIPNSIFFR